MIGISVEFDFKLPPELDPENFDSMVNEIVETTAEIARDEWVNLARENLKLTTETYIENIGPIERPNNNEAVITLTGVLPNMLEQGAASFDMKPGLLESPKAKTGKDGSRFIDIHFAHGTPTQTKVPSLPKDVFKKANTMQMGERYSDKNRRKNWNIGRPDGYEHKTGIFDDMTRSRPKGEGLNEFKSFRRISDKSDPNAFIHPGLKALHLTEKVKDYLDGQIDGIIENIMGGR